MRRRVVGGVAAESSAVASTVPVIGSRITPVARRD
jgi:hypothetical protein